MRPFNLNLLAVSICLAALPMAQAQYKYEEPGKGITYSDLPPPSNAKLLKLNNATVAESRYNSLPYELKQAVLNFPVVLYTAASCGACDEARNYLRNRGVPHTEKTIKTTEDFEALKLLSPTGNVPVLLIGKRKSLGFASTAWGEMLTDAGYPATSKLPRDYQFADAESAAPSKTAELPSNTNSSNNSGTSPASPPASGSANNAPPGFRF